MRYNRIEKIGRLVGVPFGVLSLAALGLCAYLPAAKAQRCAVTQTQRSESEGLVQRCVHQCSGSNVHEVLGVSVDLSGDKDSFPSHWTKNIEVSPVSDDERERTLEVLQVALQKYPHKVLARNLDHVYCFGDISFKGQALGGTQVGRKMYIANRGLNNGYHDWFLESIIHHETAEVLFVNHIHLFKRDEWNAHNPPSFQYADDPIAWLRTNKTNTRCTQELGERGFVSEYSTTSLMNDFSEIAAELFLNRDEFWDWVVKYPKVQAKVTIAIDLYRTMSDEFSEEYFRALPNTGRLTLIPAPMPASEIDAMTRARVVESMAHILRARKIASEYHRNDLVNRLNSEFSELKDRLQKLGPV